MVDSLVCLSFVIFFTTSEIVLEGSCETLKRKSF